MAILLPKVSVPVIIGQNYYPEYHFLSIVLVLLPRVSVLVTRSQYYYPESQVPVTKCPCYYLPEPATVTSSPYTTTSTNTCHYTCRSILSPRVPLPVTSGPYYYPENHYLSRVALLLPRVSVPVTKGPYYYPESKCLYYYPESQYLSLNVRTTTQSQYEGPAKSFVTGFGLLQCYVLSNSFSLQTFNVFPLY